MSRWLKRLKPLSRRAKLVRSRILRFDELENRRLLRSAILGDVVTLSVPVQQLEAEHARWADEAIVKTSTETIARELAYQSNQDEGEGEDDGWEYEDEASVYTIPIANNSQQARSDSSSQLPAPNPVSSGGSLSTLTYVPVTVPVVLFHDNEEIIAIRAGNAYWIGHVIVLETGREADEVAPTKKDLPASDAQPIAAPAEKAITTTPALTTKDAVEKGESEAADTALGADHLTSQGTGDGRGVPGPSPAQSGLTTPVAAPMNQKEAGSDVAQVESPDANSAAMFALPQAGDEKLAEAGASEESPATVSIPTTQVDNASGNAGWVRTGARPDWSAPAESRQRDTTRATQLPTHARHTARDQVFASSGDESQSATRWPLRAALSPDLAALERALRHLLADCGQIGSDVADWFTRPDISHWTLAATIALIAAEIVRQRAQRPRPNEYDPAYDGAEVSLRLFPELLGVPIDMRP